MSQDLSQILEERHEQYGPFDGQARIAQDLKTVMRNTPGWADLTCSQAEALEMVAHKIARVLNGDPNYADSWVDIAGYVQLVANQIKVRSAP